MHEQHSDDAFSRSRRLIGEAGLERLRGSSVFVIGLGGVGSACAEALVRAGVGNFLFIDKDCVEASNLNRQALAFRSTIGMRKVEAMKKMALDINPEASIECVDEMLLWENIDQTLSAFSEPDYIIDALDTLTAKAAIAHYANEKGVPVISSMGMANRSDPTQLEFAELMRTEGCPFCREMRKIVRDRGVGNFEVLYSKERPMRVAPEDPESRRSKTELGTFSYMPPIAGMMIAGYVIQKLLGREMFAQ